MPKDGGGVDEERLRCAEDALRRKYGGTWGQHPDFPLEDWQHQVANNETRQGYWSFVEAAVDENVDEVNSWKIEELPEHIDDQELCAEARDRVKERLEKGV